MNFLSTKRKRDNTSKSSIKPMEKEKSSNNVKSDERKFDLLGGKFRMLNELLYTSKSADAYDYFMENKDDFKIYHEGFDHQAKKWPCNPNDVLIKEFKKKKYRNKVLADLGCGEAKIALNLKGKLTVHSFDIQALNDRVTICDIKNVPLEDSSVDIAVFCLSLMGTNFIEFLLEANRILKTHGLLFIAEIDSRIGDKDRFNKALSDMKFELKKTKSIENYFTIYALRKQDVIKNGNKLWNYKNILNPCLYKKR